jgi:hypothetical protein
MVCISSIVRYRYRYRYIVMLRLDGVVWYGLWCSGRQIGCGRRYLGLAGKLGGKAGRGGGVSRAGPRRDSRWVKAD